jgi:glc operon protein GlcG
MNRHLSLGVAEADAATAACLFELDRRGKAAVIVVTDHHGELIQLLRMDGAMLPSIVIAANKAYTAARVGKPSGDVGRAALDENADVHYHGDARYVGWDGGVPILVDQTCVGAVAISGLSGAEDLEIAQIGADAIARHLAST